MKNFTYSFLFLTAVLTSCNIFAQKNKMQAAKPGITKTNSTLEKTPVITFATAENVTQIFQEKRAVLVHYGLVPAYNPEFEKKYGVKIYNAGCVVGADDGKNNNLLIAAQLDKSFGPAWQKELGFALFGMQ